MVDTRHEYAGLEAIYLPVALVVFGIVALVVLVAIVRGRRRAEASERKEHNPLEIGLAGLLVCVIAALVYFTFTTEDKVDANAPDPGLEVKITASQWNWRFSYPAYGITQQSAPDGPALLVVPTGTTVHFTGTSSDVIHAFDVPGRRFKRDLFPGSNSQFDQMWPEPGRFRGQCAEYCGLLHAHMPFVVEAMAPDDFRSWAEEQKP